MTSSIYKAYCYVLNDRLAKWIETEDKISDAQNGFRAKRSTIDQLSTLTNILEHRKKLKQSTFVAYVDFSKAYDNIKHCKLWDKLETFHINGKMLNAIKSLYGTVKCAVRVNNYITDWFNVTTGLKQGCLLSTTLFNLYINDLSEQLDIPIKGISIEGKTINHLFYADDLVLIAESEADLQLLLNILSNWCNVNKMSINVDKTKVMHFRSASVPRSN